MFKGDKELPPLSEHEQEFTDKVMALFEEQDENGEYIHDDKDVRHVLPALILGSGIGPSVYTHGPIKGLLAEFRAKMKLPDDVSDQDYLMAARRYYREYPPNKSLLSKLQEAIN